MLSSSRTIHMHKWVSHGSIRQLASTRQFAFSGEDTALLKQLSERLGKIKITNSVAEVTPDFNSTRSLPVTIFPRQQIAREVELDSKIGRWRKPAVKWWRLGTAMLQNYRKGFSNTYRVFWDTRRMPKKLDTDLFRAIEYMEMAARAAHNPVSLPQLGYERRQVQEWRRREQFWKLPVFGALVLVFEELVVGLVYLWPGLCPWNCLLPNAYKRLSDHRAERLVVPAASNKTQQYCSVYGIPQRLLLQYLRRAGLISHFKQQVYSLSGNVYLPAEILQRWQQYLFVDNWMIIRSMLETEQTLIISDRELVNIIFERQLFEKGENLNLLVQDEAGRMLLLQRLFAYLSWHFSGTVTVGGDKLYSEKWGANNMCVMNYPGPAEISSIAEIAEQQMKQALSLQTKSESK
ncbi:AaceriADR173Wp [[Ashbya] aceris (nom. inval.)]|nr:AaceriADR173Wp [[Ashbya] aceris (nom. inval.)]